MNHIELFLHMVPPTTTSQMKRAARTRNGIRFFKSEQQKNAEASWQAALAPHQPAEPVAGPVELRIALFYPYNKADTQRKADRDRVDVIPHTAKPDLDNVAKQLIDTLVQLRFIEDDAKVVDLHLSKHRACEADIGVAIQIMPCPSQSASNLEMVRPALPIQARRTYLRERP